MTLGLLLVIVAVGMFWIGVLAMGERLFTHKDILPEDTVLILTLGSAPVGIVGLILMGLGV